MSAKIVDKIKVHPLDQVRLFKYCSYCKKKEVEQDNYKYCKSCHGKILRETYNGFDELRLWRYGGYAPIS